MNTQQLAEIRKKVGLTQSAVAEALGITDRTISAWESSEPPKDLSAIESRALCELLRSMLLGDALDDMCERAFAALPSELVAIWLVQRQECILLPEAVRYQDIKENRRRDLADALVAAPLVVESLTTYPLRSGETLNLAGDAISHHRAKKYKGTRASHVLQGGVCESLLHVPEFIPSDRGPLPVLLLSLENKLDADGAVIRAGEGATALYTEDDMRTAGLLAEEFRDRLIPDLSLLGMLE
jgi:transcriptional regulator with XRE-family HTH domain